MKRLMFFSLLIGIMACHTSKPTNWAAECATRFPPRTDTFRVTAETVRFDTVLLEKQKVAYIDTTVCPPSDSARIVIKTMFGDCPPSKTVVKTVLKHDSIFIYKANVAAEKQLESDLSDEKEVNQLLQHKIAATEKTRDRNLRWAQIGWIVVALCGFVIYKIK